MPVAKFSVPVNLTYERGTFYKHPGKTFPFLFLFLAKIMCCLKSDTQLLHYLDGLATSAGEVPLVVAC